MEAPLIGADGQVHKTVTLWAHPGAVGARLSSPKRGSTPMTAMRGEGWVSPVGDSLLGGGASDEGSPEGETKAGEEADTVFAKGGRG